MIAVACVFGASLAATASPASAARLGCPTGTAARPAYAYGGFQAAAPGSAVRATISSLDVAQVPSGAVAAWVGVGGVEQGPHGETMWIQAGLVALPGSGLVAYAEIALPGSKPRFVTLQDGVTPGHEMTFAVREVRHDVWQVYLDGSPAIAPVTLRGSHGLWRPIVTSETLTTTQACNRFSVRFQDVAVRSAAGGAWKPLTPGHAFRDQGTTVRELRRDAGDQRVLSAETVRPFAFEAASA